MESKAETHEMVITGLVPFMAISAIIGTAAFFMMERAGHFYTSSLATVVLLSVLLLVVQAAFIVLSLKIGLKYPSLGGFFLLLPVIPGAGALLASFDTPGGADRLMQGLLFVSIFLYVCGGLTLLSSRFLAKHPSNDHD